MRNRKTKTDIDNIFNNIKRLAIKKFNSEAYIDSLNYINSAAIWMYHFNTRYSDNELEEIIKNISNKEIIQYKVSAPINNRIVLIDNFGLDNRGLTQQYIRGLIQLNKEILYILHATQPNHDSEIIKELKEYGNASIFILHTTPKNIIESATIIVKKIYDFSPSDILLHIAPWDIVSLLAINSVKGPTKYNINLTDHAFWLGVTFVDFNIEFRGYGESVSLEKRGFKQEQLILLPFYPIVSKYTKFEGFPNIPENSIIVFCGGSEYKMLGKNDIFFKMMDDILAISDNVYILVAGIGRGTTFEKKVNNLIHKNRVLLLGNRKDINDVFANSNIYLSSYPFIGGLMTQYAATNKVPILAYAEPNEVGTGDAFINHFGTALTSKRSKDEFLEYARSLIYDSVFRKSEGEKCYNVIMKESFFPRYLSNALDFKNTHIDFAEEHPNYNSMIAFYLDVENITHEAFSELFNRFKCKTMLIAPNHILDIVEIMIHRLLSKIFKR